MSYIKQLRANIAAEISRNDLTQTAVAELMDLPANALSGRMHGKIPFRFHELMLLAVILDVSLATLLVGVEEAFRESLQSEGENHE